MDRPVALGVKIVAVAALAFPLVSFVLAQVPAAPTAAATSAAPAGPTTLPSTEIPKDTRTSNNPAGDTKTIDAFISANIQNLMMKANPGAQQQGRDRLERAIAGVGSSNAPSPAFVNYYVSQLDKALEPAIRSKDVRTRLNAAIVVFRVTQRAQDTQLQNLAILLMQDPIDAVALWGVKSAGAMIPLSVAGGTVGSPSIVQLIQTISKTVDSHKSSAIAQEAYQALSLGAPDLKIQLIGIGPVVDEIEKVLAGREKQYLIGIPQDPASDRLAVTFLTNEKIGAVLTPAQKAKAIQLISDLIQLAGGQFANATARPEKEQLAYIVSFGAKGLLVGAAPAKGSPLEDALVKVARINVNSNPAQALTDIKAMFVLLETKAFTTLAPAPVVAGATTVPTTAPAAVTPTPATPAAAGTPAR